MAAGASTTDSWVWDPTHQLYYSPFSQAYAYTDPTTGQWVYLPTSSLGTDPSAHAESSAAAAARAGNAKSEREEGEIEDDVGWGGLMEPEELEKVMQSQAASQAKAAEKLHQNGTTTSRELEKHPAYGGGGSNTTYDDPSLYAYDRSRLRSPSPPLSSAKDKDKEVPNHILRLVVISSPTLAEGSVAVLDAREGGVQLGRDRCEKGAQPRLRIKEMEVSKTHGVVYWGTEGGKKEEWELIASDEEEDKGEEGWWIVDLGRSLLLYHWIWACILYMRRRLTARLDSWDVCNPCARGCKRDQQCSGHNRPHQRYLTLQLCKQYSQTPPPILKQDLLSPLRTPPSLPPHSRSHHTRSPHSPILAM